MDDPEFSLDEEQEAGIFTWCLNTDRLYADTAVASLFGLDPAQTLRGLPVVEYIQRVHVDDRAAVARMWSNAVMTGTPYKANYRVISERGQIRNVMAFGRCFRDGNGDPVHYAGIVHPKPELGPSHVEPT